MKSALAMVGAFLIDFQTIEFESDSKIAKEVLYELQEKCNLDGSDGCYFVLDPPISSAGWNFSKLFLSGTFVEKIYEINATEISSSKGKTFEDRFVSWLGARLTRRSCKAWVKVASEMR
jgi:hypothetical protein